MQTVSFQPQQSRRASHLHSAPLPKRRLKSGREDKRQLGRHGYKPVERDTRADAPRPAPSGRTLNLAEMAMAQVEDALLEQILAEHPRHDAALDRLLDDMDKLGVVAADVSGAAEASIEASLMGRRMPLEPAAGGRPASAPPPAFPPQQLRRIEQMLVAAVVLEGHPARDRALDRLLRDLTPDADVEAERARFDMSCDNDFDGLS